jgi:DNA-binding NarL/FixJ family response regulator
VFVRRGKANARMLTRARVLLKSDEGWTDAKIAEALDISEQAIRNIRPSVGSHLQNTNKRPPLFPAERESTPNYHPRRSSARITRWSEAAY